MPTYYDSLNESLSEWLLQQPVFFIASAPIVGKHINISPKGHPSRTLRIIDPNQVAYLDHTGSGCETIAHIYENGRVTLMAISFGPSPRILRLFCTGRVVERGTADFPAWQAKFSSSVHEDLGIDDKVSSSDSDSHADYQELLNVDMRTGARAVILLDIYKVQTSCGYGVPLLVSQVPAERAAKLTACADADWLDRETLPMWAEKLGTEKRHGYWRKNNARSLDGLPGAMVARRQKGDWRGGAEVRYWVGRVLVVQWASVLAGVVISVVVLAALGLVDDGRFAELLAQVRQGVELALYQFRR